MDSQPYNSAIAAHYAAYRPPLHEIILEKLLEGHDSFENGLDVGCGTGYSALALSKYCQSVLAIDPSSSMLEMAVAHPKITYRSATLTSLSPETNAFDIVTFAGSLYYAHSLALITALEEVCRNEALIIVYDFQILLTHALQQLGINAKSAPLNYDYTINFSDTDNFQELRVGTERLRLDILPEALAHICLAEAHLYPLFIERYNKRDPFPSLVTELTAQNKEHLLEADIYFTKYRAIPK